MRSAHFTQLRCPFCSQPFSYLSHRQFGRSKRDVRFGVLHCSCDTFPIIEGVVVLRRGLSSVVAEIIRAHAEKNSPDPQIFLHELSELRLVPRRVFVLLALITLQLRQQFVYSFDLAGKKWWQFGMWLLGHSTTNSFLQAVCNYFRQRDRRPTYVLLASLLPALHSAKTIVEVGGGAGQLIRSLASTNWRGTIFALEKNFWLTYWVACCEQWPDSICPIIVDVEVTLPLATDVADVVLANDTIMYVDHQKNLATEIKRLLKPSGWFAGMHIHTAGRFNVANGLGIKPMQWLEWLRLPYTQLFDDRQLFRQLWREKQIDITLTKILLQSTKKIGRSFSCIAATKPLRLRLEQTVDYAKTELNYLEDQW